MTSSQTSSKSNTTTSSPNTTPYVNSTHTSSSLSPRGPMTMLSSLSSMAITALTNSRRISHDPQMLLLLYTSCLLLFRCHLPALLCMGAVHLLLEQNQHPPQPRLLLFHLARRPRHPHHNRSPLLPTFSLLSIIQMRFFCARFTAFVTHFLISISFSPNTLRHTCFKFILTSSPYCSILLGVYEWYPTKDTAGIYPHSLSPTSFSPPSTLTLLNFFQHFFCPAHPTTTFHSGRVFNVISRVVLIMLICCSHNSTTTERQTCDNLYTSIWDPFSPKTCFYLSYRILCDTQDKPGEW